MTTTAHSKKVAKISISLPAELLEFVDKRQQAVGRSRSDFFREAVERAVRAEREREAEEQWIRAYREQPLTDEEAGWAVVSLGALADLPWDTDTDSEAEPQDDPDVSR